MKQYIQKITGGIQRYAIGQKKLETYTRIGEHEGLPLYGRYYRSMYSIIFEFKKVKGNSPEGLSTKAWTTSTQDTSKYLPELRAKAEQLAKEWAYKLHYHGTKGPKSKRLRFKHYLETQGEEENEIISSSDNDAQGKMKWKVSLVQGNVDYKIIHEGEKRL